MTAPDLPAGPFGAALGRRVDELSPAVRRHLVPSSPSAVHAGVIRRLWRRGLPGWIAARLLGIRGDERTPFELRNEIVPDGAGSAAMRWTRSHSCGSATVRGVGMMRFRARDGALLDRIGRRRWLEVELVPRIEHGAIAMTSARQWHRLAAWRLLLPRWLFGGAEAREWQEADGRIGLSLTLRHPFFGAYAGYEAVLSPQDRP